MKNLNWEQIVKGAYYDVNETNFGVTSTPASFNVVFENKEDAEKTSAWLKLQGGEYIEDIQLNKIYDNELLSDSTGLQCNYEVHNQTE